MKKTVKTSSVFKKKIFVLLCAVLLLSTGTAAVCHAQPAEASQDQGEDRLIEDAAAPISYGQQKDPGSIEAWEYSESEQVLFGEAEEKTGIRLGMTYGYKNIAKSGHKLPVSITVGNYEKTDIDGKLVIEAPGYLENGIDSFEPAVNRFVFDAEVKAGEELWLEGVISVPEGSHILRMVLYGSDGSVVSEKRIGIDINGNASEIFMGILSEEPGSLGYFNGVSIAQTHLRVRTIDLDPAMIPENSPELEQLDIIAVSGFDIGSLTEKQKNAIVEWVRKGGTILVGTGGNPDTARILEGALPELEIGRSRSEEVDMGMQYSKTGPDGAKLRLNVCEVGVPEGVQLMQSEDLSILTSASYGGGMIGITAYDLCDISDFCDQQMGYTEELLTLLLGPSKIEKLMNSAGSGTDIYKKTEGFIGIADTAELPNIAVYTAAAALYLIFIGCILYIWLRNRGLEIYYHAFVFISAFAGAFVIWIIGSGYRNNGLRLEYAAVRERGGTDASEYGFMHMFSSAADAYELSMPEGYDFYPVVGGGEGIEDGAETGTAVEFFSDPVNGGGSISALGLGAFAGTRLEYSRRGGQAAEESLRAELEFFNERLSGTIYNDSDHELCDTAVLVYGRILKTGDIPAHSSVTIENEEMLTAPTAVPDTSSRYIAGIDEKDEGSAEYIGALKNSRLLSWYMEDALESYFGGIRVIGFGSDKAYLSEASADIHADKSGVILDVFDIETDFENDGRIWRNGLGSSPKVLSGDYDAVSNTSRGSAVLEYRFGSEAVINSLYFTELAPEFEGEDLRAFSGQISLYNYRTGVYDYIADRRSFELSEIKPYLSPDNTMMVRYLSDDAPSGQNYMFLPVPNITGTKKK
ncbi:MAG: hypothetical protein Q4D40_03445 [Eubacteriales bacterium]|nr:hypothetical protein [Eubacteriales bacterium]